MYLVAPGIYWLQKSVMLKGETAGSTVVTVASFSFGRTWDSSLIRVPGPPARITAFIFSPLLGVDTWQNSARWATLSNNYIKAHGHSNPAFMDRCGPGTTISWLNRRSMSDGFVYE
jgi:hypothetical protein